MKIKLLATVILLCLSALNFSSSASAQDAGADAGATPTTQAECTQACFSAFLADATACDEGDCKSCVHFHQGICVVYVVDLPCAQRCLRAAENKLNTCLAACN